MEERKKTGKSYLWALFAFLLAVAADQFTKWLAVTYLKDQDPLIIIPGVFQFRYLENRGAAFGIRRHRKSDRSSGKELRSGFLLFQPD